MAEIGAGGGSYTPEPAGVGPGNSSDWYATAGGGVPGAEDQTINFGQGAAAQAEAAALQASLGNSAGPQSSSTGPLGNQLADQTALAQIETTLQEYGFSGAALQQLTQFAWNEILNGVPEAQVALDIQNTPQFNTQFPAIKERIAAGLPPITPAEYISTLDSYTQSLVAAGITPSSVNLNDLVAKDVSPTELSDRIQQGYLAIALAPQDVINAMQNYYGVTKGQLVQYFTNPNANEATLLQQAAAAQIGGAATGSGFEGHNAQSTTPAISESLALQLAQQGVTYPTAQTGFAQLANEAQLYNPLPGQGQVRGNGGAPYSASQLAEAQFFGGPAEQALNLQAAAEKAYFQAGTNLGTSGQQTAAGSFQR